MMTSPNVDITEAEWEIMRVVWANGHTTSREIIEILEDKMNWKAATIKTLIGRLVNKEALLTEKEGRKFIYSAGINEKEMIGNYSTDILTKVCSKQNNQVVENLINDAKLSRDDIDSLIALLQEKQKTAPIEVPCECIPGQCDCHLIA